MFAIGNNELKELKPVGLFVKCKQCGKKHNVRYGKIVLPDGIKVPTKMLGFINCGKESYLVSVNGKLLNQS